MPLRRLRCGRRLDYKENNNNNTNYTALTEFYFLSVRRACWRFYRIWNDCNIQLLIFKIYL